MLPQFRKYVLVNSSGQTLTYDNNGRINLKETCWIVDPTTGKITYTQLADDDLGFGAGESIANAAELIGDTEIVNTSNLYIGSQLQLEITHDEGAAAAGTFELYMAVGDATGELDTDASGYLSAAYGLRLVGQLIWNSSATDDEVIRSKIFSI